MIKLSLLLSFAAFCVSQTIAKNFDIVVEKKLNDGKDVSDNEKMTVKVSHVCQGEDIKTVVVDIQRPSQFRDKDVEIYFANDAKEVLQVLCIASHQVIATKFKTPNSKGIVLFRSDEDCSTISDSWLPAGVTKVSAAMLIQDEYYNYYGLKNYRISIPDRMVVDEYLDVSGKCP